MEEYTKNRLMYVDVHVHSFPTLVEGGTFRPFQGISLSQLEQTLRLKEGSTGIRHGVFYGSHHKQLLNESHERLWGSLSEASREYLTPRVAPMLENHRLQTLGVVPWAHLPALKCFDESSSVKTQLDAIKYIADHNGIAIIDLPNPSPKQRKDRVYRNFPGAATVDQIVNLSNSLKERTFLCYNAMEPLTWRRDAEKMSAATGLKLLGGSDAISFPSSLFSAYSQVLADNMQEIFANPSFIKDVQKGAVPFFGEKIRRYFVCGVIELMGAERRGKRVEMLLQQRLQEH